MANPSSEPVSKKEIAADVVGNIPLDSSQNDSSTDDNIFRDTSIRYLGYANEVGESFRYQYPRYVMPSYVVAFGYCIADAGWSGYSKYYCNNNNNNNNNRSDDTTTKKGHYDDNDHAVNRKNRVLGAALATVDTLVWQLLASVLIPGAVINGIVRIAKHAVGNYNSNNSSSNLLAGHHHSAAGATARTVLAKKWIPTTIGLLSIPLIVHPIDVAVDYIMDETVRPYFYSVSLGRQS